MFAKLQLAMIKSHVVL